MRVFEPWHLLVLLAFLVVGIAIVVGVILLIVKALAPSPARHDRAPQPGVVPAPPGWYPQPDGTQRWWDGREWTVSGGPAQQQ